MASSPLNARAVFDEAAEIASPAERRAYLERVCADAPVLRQQVEALLAAYADAGSFLETPPAPPRDHMDLRPAAERPGTMIGPYELLQQIGEGGMGVVWLAEQTQPVQRKVALKVIKPGMDSKQVVARFEAERQALAVMDHVNIARVCDGGATDAGLPYFVMELVHGVPITKYCDDNRLTPRERLELFVPVCQAIQHAHQKGIIHRDIKPSNVLVALYDGRPMPKVIDFGVAKATEQRPGERTLFTQCGTLVGTLEYMSPEQAEMSALGVDTRSDIFSLGVLLYELLTGSTPLTHERMKQAAHAELLRMIREEEPPKPSTRLSESGDRLASISANRHTEPARLTKLMRGDLDWILMKCLEKDRSRRYETANGLAVDILRHLNDEPVTAGAPSAGYRFRKFVKRNRAKVIAAAIVAGVLVLGVVGTTSGMIWALEEKDRADEEAARATLAAQSEAAAKAQAQENEKKAIAEARRAEAMSALANAKATELDAKVSEFDQLAGIVLCERAIASEKELYPAKPNKIEAMERWLRDDAGKVLAMKGGIERTVRDLEARSPPPTAADLEADRRTHPRFAEYELLGKRVASLRYAQAIRGGAPLVVPRLTPEQQALDAKALNTLVWARVALRPEERTVWGEEALALALAQAAAAAAGYGTDDEYQYLDTMAWALLANGQDAEAKAKSAEALGKAPDNEQEAYRGYQGDLETAITQAAEIMAAAEKRLAELTTAVGRRRTFRFELESQRFLHDALAELLGKLDLLERTQKAGVEQRLSWAKQVQALSLHHPNARHTWAAVRAAIASNPKYAGSPIELRDQDITGLVPIGENPVTRLWEFYELRSAWDGKQDPRTIAIPAHAADGSIEVTEELGIVFVLLPGGRFLMGAQKDDANLPNYDRAANPNEQPHEVTLAPYFLARHELTQGQWARLWAGGEGRWPSWYKVGAGYTGIGRVTAAQPVENVSWAMCSQVMEQNGLVLPTEAQWEYACRAGTTTPWYTGSTPETIEGHGNILDQTGQNVPPVWAGGEAFDDGFKGPAPVGHYEANAFGMFDMYGNVCEWCRDWDGVYGSERAGDGLRSGGDSSSRCYRGGGSIHAAANARSANRSHHGHSIRLNMIGVRPAR